VKLVVFDLDGTLTRTNRVDEECFTLAVTEILPLTQLDQNWDDYEHVTDDGITQQLFARRFGRHPVPDETERIVDRFVELLAERHGMDTSDFSQIAGAGALVNQLKGNSSWRIALATGAWRRSAEFKIHRAALPLDGVPSAFAEDGPSRESVVRTAIERAARTYGQSEFERVVSVGDALWDVKTARNLRLPFIGIAGGQKAGLLRDNGASHVIEDYRDMERCLRYLEEAETP
jgi:phosphoglycolate phosphatase-like HAD superfamily hydrolase